MKLADFERIPELRKLMEFELNEVENCHEKATSITSRITGMPNGKGGNSSKVENAVVQAETHYARYCKYCDELREIFDRLKKEGKKLSECQWKTVEMYYVQNMRVGKIAQEMELTERHVFRLKKEAISMLCDDYLP